jgi:hypothetical protein
MTDDSGYRAVVGDSPKPRRVGSADDLSLIPKLRAEPAASAVATLGLTRYVDRMHEGNEEFKQAFEASALDRSDEPPTNRAAANPVRWHLSQFASNLMYLGATDAAFAPLAAQIRQFIDDAEAIARARRTRRESEGEDESPAPPADTPSQ